MKKCLGVIGGLGPMASAQFLELLTDLTDAACDQDHIETYLCSRPGTPDRTAFLLGNSTESPLPALLASGQALERMGAEVLAIPCMTAYGFYDALRTAFSATLLHPIRETAHLLADNGVQQVGLMATDGTLRAGIFQTELERQGITVLLPERLHQQRVMHMIYDDVKSGKPVCLRTFSAVGNRLRERGAETVILGCTELSVVNRRQTIGAGYLDAMEVLAASAIRACGYQTRRTVFAGALSAKTPIAIKGAN